jgi:hypothetical protein
VSPSISWGEIAESTQGFSGADLQALIYNAHLEVVHSSIAENPKLGKTAASEEQPIEYVILGGPEDKSVVSRAEESAIQRRVIVWPLVPWFNDDSLLFAAAPNPFRCSINRYQVVEYVGQAKTGTKTCKVV